MHDARHLTVALNAALVAAGLKHKAVYVPAEDFESEDDEVEFHLLGAPICMGLQVGPYGTVLNEYIYKRGHLNGLRHLRDFDRSNPHDVVAAVVDTLKQRQQVAA